MCALLLPPSASLLCRLLYDFLRNFLTGTFLAAAFLATFFADASLAVFLVTAFFAAFLPDAFSAGAVFRTCVTVI